MDNISKNIIEAKLNVIDQKLDQLISLVGPFGVSMQDNTTLVQTIYNTKYYIPCDDDIMTPQLIIYRQWEKNVSEFLLSKVNSETVFLDIGANFGYFSCLIASKIGAGNLGRVYAFEANPKMTNLLRRNIEINWGMAAVDVHEIAVTEKAGVLQLNIPKKHLANASLGQMGAGVEVDVVNVEADSIDNLLHSLERVDLVKIDVEGVEYLVLKGMVNTIDNNPNIKIIMEWSAGQMHDAGIRKDDILDFICERGFKIYEIETNTELTREQCLSLDYGNLYLYKS